jgi:hypothetical protein
MLSRILKRRSSPKPTHPTLGITRGVGFILVSTLLAWASFDATQKTTIVEYRNTHPLPAIAWKSLLRNSGYQLMRDSHDFARSIRSDDLPAPGGIRLSHDRNLLILPAMDPDEGITLWSRSEAIIPPTEWDTLPASLIGFENLAKAFEISPPRNGAVAIQTPAKKAKWIDPKMIRY